MGAGVGVAIKVARGRHAGAVVVMEATHGIEWRRASVQRGRPLAYTQVCA